MGNGVVMKGQFVDTTQDGVADSLAVDTTGDGVVNLAVPMTDTSGDGQFDSVVVDSNGDGVADSVIAIKVGFGENESSDIKISVKETSPGQLQLIVPAGKTLTLDDCVDAVSTFVESQVEGQLAATATVREVDFDIQSAIVGMLSIPKPSLPISETAADIPWQVPGDFASLTAGANNTIVFDGNLLVYCAPPDPVVCCAIL